MCCHALSSWDAGKLEACETGKHQNKSQESGSVKGQGQVQGTLQQLGHVVGRLGCTFWLSSWPCSAVTAKGMWRRARGAEALPYLPWVLTVIKQNWGVNLVTS